MSYMTLKRKQGPLARLIARIREATGGFRITAFLAAVLVAAALAGLKFFDSNPTPEVESLVYTIVVGLLTLIFGDSQRPLDVEPAPESEPDHDG